MSNKGDIQATILQGLLRGEKGDTPVKGVDYWTEEDREQLADETIETLEESIETSTDPITADDKLIMAIAGVLAKVDYTLLAKAIVEQYSGNDFGDYNAPNQTLQRAITKLLNVVESGQRRYINTMDDLNDLGTAFEQGVMSLPASISPTGSSMTCTYITSCSTRSTSRTLDITDLATGKRYVTRRENLSSAWAEWKEIPVTNWPDSSAALGENDSILVSRNGELGKIDYSLLADEILTNYRICQTYETVEEMLNALRSNVGSLVIYDYTVSRSGGYNNPSGECYFDIDNGNYAKMIAYPRNIDPANPVTDYIEGLVMCDEATGNVYFQEVAKSVTQGGISVHVLPNSIRFDNPYLDTDYNLNFMFLQFVGDGIYFHQE